MTEKLFYNEAFERAGTFTAQVVSTCLSETLTISVILDKTLFFPEEGGQECDRGYLFLTDSFMRNGQREPKSYSAGEVTETDAFSGYSDLAGEICLQIQHVSLKDGVITHHCTPVRFMQRENPLSEQEALQFAEAIHEGESLTGVVDVRHRLDQMQQHTAEHIISGLVHAAYGYDNVGFHLSERSVTMDYDGVLTREQVAEIEKQANEVVWQNIPVRAYFPTEEELRTISYRSKKEIEGEALRLVEVPGVDLCACCAPHVERTGEIGLIKVIRLQNYKGGVRLSIVCGERACALFAESFDMLQNLASALSTSVENIPDRFVAMQEEISSLKEALVAFRKEKAGALLDTAIVDGEHAVLTVGSEQGKDIRNIVNKLMELHTGYCAVFAGDSVEGYRYCLGSTALDARAAQAGLQKLFSAKGGGSAQMVQGSIPAGTELDRFSWQELLGVE